MCLIDLLTPDNAANAPFGTYSITLHLSKVYDGVIDIDIDIAIDIVIDIAIYIEGRKTLILSLTLSVFYCQIIGIEHWKHQVTLANSASQWRVLEHWIWWTNFSNIIKGCMPSQIQMIEKCDMWTNAIIV